MVCKVYILKSQKDGRLYIGQTQNLDHRLSYHNNGRAKYSKNFAPWSLLYSKTCNSRSEAIILERKIKRLKSREDILVFAKNHDFVKH